MSHATQDLKESQPSTSYSAEWSHPCRQFELPEILSATQNFDESLVIGHGGFGKVYRATILIGSTPVVAAIKRLNSSSNQGAAEFWAEVEVLSKLRHCHLVSLFGYCNYEKEMILIYEYMPNGTLEDHLHTLRTSLSWIQRLKICIGAARGLHYLHTGTGIEVGVMHRDVKSSNILLHESWAAKISDFGLSRMGPTNQPSTYVNTFVKGTFGYLDPNYFATGKLTRKSDVYAFGVVLFEVLCRKRAVDSSLNEEEYGLVTWAQDSIKEGNLKRIIDSDIKGDISPKCLKEFVRIAERCVLSNPKQRPTMAETLFSLESAVTLQMKFDSSLQVPGKLLFGRLLDMFSFPSNRENSASSDTKPSRSTVGVDNNMLPEMRYIADFRTLRPNLRAFTFSDLKRATSNFSSDMLLGAGCFGDVYLGWFDQKTFIPSNTGNGLVVAVKRFNLENLQGHEEWEAEVNLLGAFTHPNIISLLGFCLEDKEHLLVYEYMQNRSLDRFLFRYAPDNAEQLSWAIRLRIMIGVARGLTFLHWLKSPVVFRHFNCSIILLDQDYNAKLVDFRLAKADEIGKTHITPGVLGTYGDAGPEYIANGHSGDIYGFGVVLLETLTGLPSLDFKRPHLQHNLVDWTRPILNNRRKLKKIIDPRLEQNYPVEAAFKCAALISRCLESNPKDRPSSEEVLQSLEQINAHNK